MAIGGLLNVIRQAPKTLGRGSLGLIVAAGTGVSVYAGYKDHGETYGAGAGIAAGLGEAALFTVLPPMISIPAAGLYFGGVALKDFGQDIYRKNRRVNLGQHMHDPFGSLATMRQRSSTTLDRGRASLGNEARLLHF